MSDMFTASDHDHVCAVVSISSSLLLFLMESLFDAMVCANPPYCKKSPYNSPLG